MEVVADAVTWRGAKNGEGKGKAWWGFCDIDDLKNKIAMNTVDSFQDQGQDIIYISLVWSNEKGEIGFLSDTRRMNVAITCAKKKLVIIGHSGTIGTHPNY